MDSGFKTTARSCRPLPRLQLTSHTVILVGNHSTFSVTPVFSFDSRRLFNLACSRNWSIGQGGPNKNPGGRLIPPRLTRDIYRLLLVDWSRRSSQDALGTWNIVKSCRCKFSKVRERESENWFEFSSKYCTLFTINFSCTLSNLESLKERNIQNITLTLCTLHCSSGSHYISVLDYVKRLCKWIH